MLQCSEYAMYVRFLFKQRWHIRHGQMERECMDIKDIQQTVGTVWKRLDMPLSHCWRSALSEIHRCVPPTLEATLCEATKPKGESVFDTRLEASFGFKRGAVEELYMSA